MLHAGRSSSDVLTHRQGESQSSTKGGTPRLGTPGAPGGKRPQIGSCSWWEMALDHVVHLEKFRACDSGQVGMAAHLPPPPGKVSECAREWVTPNS